jgi:arginase
MRNVGVIEAPSILGLKPGGVEKLPEALKAQGLLNRIPVVYEEKIIPPSYSRQRDTKTNILNPNVIHDFSVKLADAVQKTARTRKVYAGAWRGLQHCHWLPFGASKSG